MNNPLRQAFQHLVEFPSALPLGTSGLVPVERAGKFSEDNRLRDRTSHQNSGIRDIPSEKIRYLLNKYGRERRNGDMALERLSRDELTFKPVTMNEWLDFTSLFEEPGPQNGCWCMYWRVKRADCQKQFGEGNK
jgi:hypothetical protein